MKVRITKAGVIASFRAPSVNAACDLIDYNAAYPPNGYRWERSVIKRRGHGGRQVNVDVLFTHCDKRIPAMTEDEAYATFRGDPGPGTDRRQSANPPGT